jgi:hypothetical protein
MSEYKIRDIGDVRLIDLETGKVMFEGKVYRPSLEELLKSSKEYLELFYKTQKYGGRLSDRGVKGLEEIINQIELYV